MNYSVQYTWPDGSTDIDPDYATNAPAHIIECVGKLFQFAIEQSQTIELPAEIEEGVGPHVTHGFPRGSGWRNEQIAEELHAVIKAGEVLNAKIRALAGSGYTLTGTKTVLAKEADAFNDLLAKAANRIAKLYAVLRRYDQWSDFEVVLLALMHLKRLEGALTDHEALSATYADLAAAEEGRMRALCAAKRVQHSWH